MAISAKIQISTLKDYLAKYAKNLTWVFFAVFLIMLAMEALEVQHSVAIVLESNQTPPLVASQPGVRVDFKGYDAVIQRISNGQTYQPDNTAYPNSFGTGK